MRRVRARGLHLFVLRKCSPMTAFDSMKLERRAFLQKIAAMTRSKTAGARFREAIRKERPLQIVGVINAYSALLAERAGFKTIYLSGAGVANASFGLPDLGLIHLEEVLQEVRRIGAVTNLPLLVDADTGWGTALAIGRATRGMIRAGA